MTVTTSYLYTKSELVDTEVAFRNKKGFPGVIGAIDGSHIQIQSPQNFPENHVNRKGFYSLILQGVCDHNLKFFHLLGDSAYPLEEWFHIPFKERGNLSNDQAEYNYVHSSTRMAIERAFGMLKGRFPILKFVRWSRIEDICTLVMTTLVFHNICFLHEEDVEFFIDNEEEINKYLNILTNDNIGTVKRANIVEILKKLAYIKC